MITLLRFICERNICIWGISLEEQGKAAFVSYIESLILGLDFVCNTGFLHLHETKGIYMSSYRTWLLANYVCEKGDGGGGEIDLKFFFSLVF